MCKRMKRVILVLVLLMIGTGSVSGAPCPDGMVSHWKLDEMFGTTAVDCYGHADGRTYGATLGQDGRVGTAYDFNGINDYIDCGNDESLDLDDDFTVMAWVKTSNAGFILHKKNSNSPYQGISFYVSSNVLRSRITDTGPTNYDNTGSGTVTDDKWHHVALVADKGGNAQLYVDGQANGSSTDLSSMGDIVNTVNLEIGVSNAGSSHFDGLIDEVVILDEALDANDINDIYQAGLAGDALCCMLDSGIITASYIIFHDNDSPKNYYAKEGTTGKMEFSGTDANAVINDAISALGSNGGKIFFKSGEYIITSDITMPHNVFLIGEAAQTTRLYFKNACGIKVNENGTPKRTGAIKNFYIDGYQPGDSNSVDGTAISVENVQFFEVENCQFTEVDTCLELKGACYFSRIKGNGFRYYHEYGIHLCADSAGRHPNALWIENNEFAGGRGTDPNSTQAVAAIYIERGSGGVASNNYFETGGNYIKHWVWLKDHSWKITNSKLGAGPADNSIQIETRGRSTTHTTIIGCKVYGSGGNSIYVDMSEEPDPRYIKLCGCLLYGRGTIDANTNGKVKFYITNSYFKATRANNHLLHLVESGNVIVGNQFYTNKNYDLIHTEDINDSVIADNVFLGGTDGIELSSSSRNNAITGNTFSGQSNAAINTSGTGTTNIIRNNVGYVTESSGAATGASPITVAHGLAGTPASVVLTPRTSCKFSVTSRNGTNFVITHDAGTSVTFDWYAEYKP